mmetsp:Transcript_38913/g.54050  ORF Transcript_38913/g.54050 Transcript_38913/m.54050 type:complete len:92 (-) Transcript_38913:68-343(-)
MIQMQKSFLKSLCCCCFEAPLSTEDLILVEEAQRREALEARDQASQAAQQRQEAFDRSVTGRAAKKSVIAAKKNTAQNSRDEDVARMWQQS